MIMRPFADLRHDHNESLTIATSPVRTVVRVIASIVCEGYCKHLK